jgi:hypothetical protein
METTCRRNESDEYLKAAVVQRLHDEDEQAKRLIDRRFMISAQLCSSLLHSVGTTVSILACD